MIGYNISPKEGIATVHVLNFDLTGVSEDSVEHLKINLAWLVHYLSFMLIQLLWVSLV